MKIKNGELLHIDHKEIIEGTYVVPDGVTVLGEWIFSGYTSIRRVVLPGTVEVIRGNAFYGCLGLEEIHLPGSIREIGSGAFRNCVGLQKIQLPEISAIENSVFAGCVSLERLEIPDSVRRIGAYAFENCVKLECLDIRYPRRITQIGVNAFLNCSRLDPFWPMMERSMNVPEKANKGNGPIVDARSGARLMPGDPEHCQGNGKNPDLEYCCDHCDYLLVCHL